MNDTNMHEEESEKPAAEEGTRSDAGNESQPHEAGGEQPETNPFEVAARRALAEGSFLSEEEEEAIEGMRDEEMRDEGDEEDEEMEDDEEIGDEGIDEAYAIERGMTEGSDWVEDLVHDDADLNELEMPAIAGNADDDADQASTIDVAPDEELLELVEGPAENIPGTIVLVGVPIANRDDITLRAVRTLQAVDVVVCEEYKTAARLLRIYNISKKLIEVNEQNEGTTSDEVIAMLRAGKRVAVIADAGLPFITAPESMLMRKLSSLGVTPKIVPGVSSVLMGLMASGFSMESFDFVGFLPRRPEERKRAAESLTGRERTLVILEAPHRLRSLLVALSDAMPDRRAAIAINLTTPFEATIRGTLAELMEKFSQKRFKGEFVVVLDRMTPADRTRRDAAERSAPVIEEEEIEMGEEAGAVESAGGWQRTRPERARPEQREPERGGGWSPLKKERGAGRREGWERPQRPERRERSEGWGRPERPERRERSEGWQRPERREPQRGWKDRGEGEGWKREDRGERRNDRRDERGGERRERPGGERRERPGGWGGDRNDRGGRQGHRLERRDDRGERRERPGGWRNDRPERGGGWREERPGRGDDRPRRDFGSRDFGSRESGPRGGSGGRRDFGSGGGQQGPRRDFGSGGGQRGPRRDFGGPRRDFGGPRRDFGSRGGSDSRGGGFRGKKRG